MLFIFSKEKILSYVIAFSTVAILIGISTLGTKRQDTAQASANIIKNNTVNVINME